MNRDFSQINVPDMWDKFILRIGHVLSWCNGLLVLVILVHVISRYLMGHALVVLEEMEWHLYSIAIMFGISYAMVTNSHIRVDLFSKRFSKLSQERIEIFGILFLLLPYATVVFIHSLHFVEDSWIHNERSTALMGLPWRWAIKSVIPISYLFIGLTAIARLFHIIKSRRQHYGNR